MDNKMNNITGHGEDKKEKEQLLSLRSIKNRLTHCEKKKKLMHPKSIHAMPK